MTLPSLKQIFTAHQLKQGEKIPRWYGIAYWDPSMDVAICYPIPINWIVAGRRWILGKLMHGEALQAHEMKIYKAGHSAGVLQTEKRFQDIYKHAWSDGYRACGDAVIGELDRHTKERNQ